MKRIEIVKSGKALTQDCWALLRNDNQEYSVITTIDLVEPKETEMDDKIYRTIQWLPFSSTTHLDNKVSTSKVAYFKNSKLNFGMYKGYEVGIVYSFDAPYLEWCIENISNFYIADLDVIEEFGVIRYNDKYDIVREIGDGSLNTWLNYFSTIQDIAREIGFAYTKYRFSESAQLINNERMRNHL
ncbi:hypothetical protein [Salmonirosea aquatica]|uniref:DUF402 domain-containing protein n=1 Tax=Salmonirosea aquatica TaxID=2654236 RepID=A0A7C9BCW9_9BACT|nr:hypothetical protein [Cytophagaceae bacterium SJW1-29]MPR31932.1 hypothetical protein [Cytophagaceae bacterium SJW1-29]